MRMGIAAAVLAAILSPACNMGGDANTPHGAVNPAMGGAPSESDHTNTDVDDQAGGYGTGTAGEVKDDNVQHLHGAAAPAPKDSSAAVPKK